MEPATAADDDHVSAGLDRVLVYGAHHVRMGQVRLGAPDLGVHLHAPALDVGAGAAVKDDQFSGGEFVSDVIVHGTGTFLQPMLTGSTPRACMKATMWKRIWPGA